MNSLVYTTEHLTHSPYWQNHEHRKEYTSHSYFPWIANDSLTSYILVLHTYYTVLCLCLEGHLLPSVYPQDAIIYSVWVCLRKLVLYCVRIQKSVLFHWHAHRMWTSFKCCKVNTLNGVCPLLEEGRVLCVLVCLHMCRVVWAHVERVGEWCIFMNGFLTFPPFIPRLLWSESYRSQTIISPGLRKCYRGWMGVLSKD